jgi:hypothetical protein
MPDIGPMWGDLAADVREALTGEAAPPSEDDACMAAKVLIKAQEIVARMKSSRAFAETVRPHLARVKRAAAAAERAAGKRGSDNE